MQSAWKCDGIADRTRFFVNIAKTDGIQLAALAYYVAVCRCTRQKPGCWTAKHLGKQIGLGHWQIRQLLKRAAHPDVQLLFSERTTRGFRIWPHPVFARWLQIKSERQVPTNSCPRPRLAKTGYVSPLRDVHKVGYYRLSTAKQFGYTGSVLLELLDPEPREELPRPKTTLPPRVRQKIKDGELLHVGELINVADWAEENGTLKDRPKVNRITPQRAAELFPWMTEKTARRALRRLVKAGYLACSETPGPLVRWDSAEGDWFDSRWVQVPDEERPAQGFWLTKSRWMKNDPGDKANTRRDNPNRPSDIPNRLADICATR